MGRNRSVDIIKGLAIIFVIILHSLSTNTLLHIGAPFLVWQAVPIFMILAGYNGVNSYLNREINDISSAYSKKLLTKRYIRLLKPFVLIWIFEVALNLIMHNSISIKGAIFSFITGGWGPGSYFIPIMLQHVIVLPLLYLGAKKSVNGMLMVAFLLDMGLELVTYKLGLSPALYRILYHRYLFAVALGVWAVMYKGKKSIILSIGSLISLVFIIAVNYFNFQLPIEPSWMNESAPSHFWALLIVILGLKFLPKVESTFLEKKIALLGKASYHIFLVQMVYFFLINAFKLPINNIFVVMNVIICLVVGYGFFKFESSISKNKNKVEVSKQAS